MEIILRILICFPGIFFIPLPIANSGDSDLCVLGGVSY
jgi:hypothetical protein